MDFLSPSQAKSLRPSFQDVEVSGLGTLRIRRLPIVEKFSLANIWNDADRDPETDEIAQEAVFMTFSKMVCRCLESPNPDESWDTEEGYEVICSLDIKELSRLKTIVMDLNGLSSADEFDDSVEDETEEVKNA